MKKLRAIPNSWFAVKEAKSLRGLPDIYGCVNGRFIALECKRSQSESLHNTGRICLQKKILRDIQRSGGFASFIYPENEAELLESIKKFND